MGLWVWSLIGYVIDCSILCGYFGLMEDELDDIWAIVVFWPIILSLLVIIAPFVGMHSLGKKIAKKKAERKAIIRRFKHLFWKLDLDEDD